ncbi:hypothetical protein [Streptomyces sp. NPDC018693]|uniref:hypothetical protein n=1 Tax=unclassified Streptomyces TaxID=2593676 RepID=UPI00379D1F6B
MKRVGYVFGGLAAAGAGSYLVVYLYRWQWQRAILCGVLLLVVEVMLLGAVLLSRLARIERRIEDGERRQRDVLARLREQERQTRRFRWLDEPAERTFVFVPVLMVAGVLLSGLAWLVQRIAANTVRGPAERRLAGRLAVLAAPPSPAATAIDSPATAIAAPAGRGASFLLAQDNPVDLGTGGPAAPVDLEDLPPLPPGRSPRRTAVLGVGAVVTAGLLTALVVGLADLTQTRAERPNENEATSILLRIDVRGADMTVQRQALAAEQIWERCRDSTSVPLGHTTLGSLDDGVFAGVVRPALGHHDQLRLRGCLEDATVDRAHLTVMGIGDADADTQ